MSDLRRLDSLTADVQTRVVAPEFDRLVTVSRRRRRNSVVASGVAAAAVIAVAAVGVRGVYGDQSAPVVPSHTGPPTRTSHPTDTSPPRVTELPGVAAEAIIDNPRARLWGTAVLPEHPESLAVMWHVPGKGFALALTSDGFAHRTNVLLSGLYPSVSAAGPSAFWVEQRGTASLMSPDGSTRPVTVAHAPGPLAPGEYLVPWHSHSTLAVDPRTAVAHRLLLPSNAHDVYGGNGLVWTIAYPPDGPREVFDNSLDWSTDGGRTWSSHPLPSGQMVWFDPVASPPGTMVVKQGGQDTPGLGWLVASRDSGRTWTSVDAGRHVYAAVEWAAAARDGRLLVDALRWSERPANWRHAQGSALLSSAGRDWTRFAPMASRLSSGQPINAADSELATTSTDGSRFLLYVSHEVAGKVQLLMSEDGGSTWTPVRDR